MPQKEVRDIKQPKGKMVRIYWQGPEFIYYPKSNSWYIGISIIALIMIGIFIWAKQYFSAGIVFLIAAVMFILSKNKPENIKYALDPSGLTFKNKVHSLDEFKSFWIVGGDYISTLYLERTNRLSPPLTVHITQINPQPIKDFLRQYLPEKVGKGDILDEKFSRFLRF